MIEGEKRFTKTGKRARASYEEVANWVDASCKDIDVQLVKRSFIGCAFTSHRQETQLHSKLFPYVSNSSAVINLDENDEESTGITDDEMSIESESESVKQS